jgi:ketoreductase RED2
MMARLLPLRQVSRRWPICHQSRWCAATAALPLSGQVCLVTGGTSGIGAAVARRLAVEGAVVAVNGRSAGDKGERVARDLSQSAIYARADVSQDADCRNLVNEVVARLGRIDHLINCAGVNLGGIPHEDLEAVDDEKMRRLFDLNFFGVLYMCRAALPHLKESAGDSSIVNITSTAAIRCTGSSLPYSVSKAAVNHMTTLLAKSVGPQGIRVNGVAPGYTDTPLVEGPAFDAIKARVAEQCPLGRIAQPEDIAEAVTSLCHMKFVSGQILVVDGGLQWNT